MTRSPQCAFCGEEVYTRSAWRVGQDWFCSQSCFQKYESWRSGRSQLEPRPVTTPQASAGRRPKRPRGFGLVRPRTVLIAGTILGGLALLAWFKPLLHEGARAAKEVNEVGAVPREAPRLESGWLLAAINARRRRIGRQPLTADRAASLLAQQQSSRMADGGRLFVIPNRDLEPFANGGTVAEREFQYGGGSLLPFTGGKVFAWMMKKGSVRRESVAGRFNRVGIGITRRPAMLWGDADLHPGMIEWRTRSLRDLLDLL